MPSRRKLFSDFNALLRSDITDAAATAPAADAPLSCGAVRPREEDLSNVAPTNHTSGMGEAKVELGLAQTVALGVSRFSKHLYHSPSLQHCAYVSWIRENIHKKECCFFESGVR